LIFAVILVVSGIASLSQAAEAGQLARRNFGQMPDGRAVEAITLSNRQGASATIITYGAALQSLVLPDTKGGKVDVVLGWSPSAPMAQI
jgi:aldose 1-epimerase